jgi:hypothetical protein
MGDCFRTATGGFLNPDGVRADQIDLPAMTGTGFDLEGDVRTDDELLDLAKAWGSALQTQPTPPQTVANGAVSAVQENLAVEHATRPRWTPPPLSASKDELAKRVVFTANRSLDRGVDDVKVTCKPGGGLVATPFIRWQSP